jgi:hypothetical protein
MDKVFVVVLLRPQHLVTLAVGGFINLKLGIMHYVKKWTKLHVYELGPQTKHKRNAGSLYESNK